MQEIKPCPFCGGKASICDRCISPTGKVFFIMCEKSECHGNITDLNVNYTKQEAIKAWNTRQPTPVPLSEEKHCKDCCCAKAWEALEIKEYTGKGIVEYIRELVDYKKSGVNSLEETP